MVGKRSVLIDTHCHLNFKVFRSRVGEVVERGRLAGVEKMVVVGTHLKNSRLAIRQAAAHNELFASVGIHPHHVWDYYTKAKQQATMSGQNLAEILDIILEQIRPELKELASQPKVVAIGETGLDQHFYQLTQYQDKQPEPAYFTWQKAFFQLQLETAADHNLPVIIHQREAIHELLNFFADHPQLVQPERMVLHCCEPDERQLDFAKTHQLYIGVDGDVTYDPIKQQFIRQVPIKMLLLETDAPFMLPEPDRTKFAHLEPKPPYKDRACEPRHIASIAQFLTNLLNKNLAEITNQTTTNAEKLFFDRLCLA